MYKIVKIKPCHKLENNGIVDGAIEELTVDNAEAAWDIAKEFVGNSPKGSGILSTFWGTWEEKRVLFLVDDNGIAQKLWPNKQATLAYLDQCIPGTMHVIVGPVVGLLHKDLW